MDGKFFRSEELKEKEERREDERREERIVLSDIEIRNNACRSDS